MSRDTENEARKKIDDLAALNPSELHRFRPMFDKVLIRRRPRKTTHGILHIPRAYQDHPLDGEVVAVGPGRPFLPRHCTVPKLEKEFTTEIGGGTRVHGFREGDPCGVSAEFIGERDNGTSEYFCRTHAHEYGGNFDMRPLLTHRPVGVAVGDHVAFSSYAEGHHVRRIGGEEYILTDDVTMVLGPGVVVERP